MRQLFWLGLFLLGTPIVFYKGMKDAYWAIAGVTYLYFAIPYKEFIGAPALPYSLIFSALGMASSLRYYQTLKAERRTELIQKGTKVVGDAVESVRQMLIETVATAAVQNRMSGEILAEALRKCEEPAILRAQAEAPAALTVITARVTRSVLGTAAQAAEREAIRVRESGLPTRGALHQHTVSAVTTIVDNAISGTVETTKRQISDVVNEIDGEKIPTPRGPLAAIISNTGVWSHALFTLLTYVGAGYALYSQSNAMDKVSVCVLLFVPMFTIIMGVRTPKHFLLFAGAWMLGTFHLAMNGITYWVSFGGRADNAGGQGGEANFLGGMCSIVVPMALGLVLHIKKPLFRFGALAVAGIYVLGILASGSRASLMATVGLMGWWVIRTNRRASAVGVAMLAALGFMMVAPDSFWERMGTTFGAKDDNQWVQGGVEESKAQRLILWDLAIKHFKLHPLSGIGPNNFSEVSAVETEITDAYEGKRGLQTHNSWLQILCEYGIIGFIVWAGAYAFSIICFARARQRLKGYAGYEWFGAICLGYECGMLGCIVFLTFNSTHWHDYLYWHFILGPLALQLARDHGDWLDWIKPAAPGGAYERPRYGPPKEGLSLDIDLSESAPLIVQR